MKSSKKKVLFYSISACFVVFIAALLLIVNGEKLKPHTKIAFYRISDLQVQAVENQLEGLKDANGNNVLFKFTVLDGSKPLGPQLKNHFDAVITLQGKCANDAASSVSERDEDSVFPSKDILNECTISVRQSVSERDSQFIKQIPFLMDIYGFEADARRFSGEAYAFANPDFFTAILSEQKDIVAEPLCFAGSDTSTYISLLSCLTEAMEGKDAYIAKAQKLSSMYTGTSLPSDDSSGTVSEKINSLFADEIELLGEWRAAGIIKDDLLDFDAEKVEQLMNDNDTVCVFMSLSDHRKIDQETAEKFSSIPGLSDESLPYIPSRASPDQRHFVAPVTVFIPLSSRKNVSACAERLLDEKTQESLCRITGLAPVLASCRTPDMQSDDVRYWIAATGFPLSSFSELCFTSDEQRKDFANRLNIFKRY